MRRSVGLARTVNDRRTHEKCTGAARLRYLLRLSARHGALGRLTVMTYQIISTPGPVAYTDPH